MIFSKDPEDKKLSSLSFIQSDLSKPKISSVIINPMEELVNHENNNKEISQNSDKFHINFLSDPNHSSDIAQKMQVDVNYSIQENKKSPND